MSAGDLVAATVIVAVGAMVQSSIGFGLNVVGAPLLVLVDPRFVPGPTLIAALVLTILVGIRERGSVDRRGFWWIFAGRIPGSVVAALVVSALPPRGIAFALSGIVLLAVAASVAGWTVRRTPRNLVVAGTISGAFSTLSSVGGPPIAMLYQDAKGSELRGTLAAVFTVGAAISIGLLAAVGRFGVREVDLAFALMPGVFAGFALSRYANRLLDRHPMRGPVLALCAIAAVAAVIRYAI
jgi:uncharacterized membrane protein YfcA